MTEAKPVLWHLCSNRWHSAVTEYALSACEAMSEIGYSSVFVGKTKSPGLKQALQRGIATVAVNSFAGLAGFCRMNNLGISNNDVVFTYGGPETTAAQFFSLGKKRFRVRADPLRGASAGLFASEYWARINIAGLIYPSHALRKNPKLKLCEYEKVIPLGRPDKFCIATNATSDASRPELLIVGRLDPVKGHIETIKFFSKLCRTELAIRPKLIIIGEPKNISEGAITELVAELKLEKDFELITDRVKDIEKRMSQATVGLIPSLGSEYICRVAEEFLLCGTPVIVSGVGALKETLFEGAGICYEGKSESEKLSMISKYIDDCYGESQAARYERAKQAQSRYSMSKMASALESVFV